MKTFGIEQATLDICIREAQSDRVLVTRDGRPVAMVVGLGRVGRRSTPTRGERQVLGADHSASEAAYRDS